MAEPPLDTSRPFLTRHALVSGITPGALRGPRYVRLDKGVHVEASTVVTPLLLVHAALATHPPGAFASHLSAAEVYGMPVPASSVRHVSVFDPGDRRRRPGVTSHLASPGTRVVSVRGTRVSTPAQVFVELASLIDLVDLVAVGDFIVRKGWHAPAELVAHCSTSTDVHAKRALAASRFVRAEVDSPMESRSRMLVVLAGLPEPEVNVKIRNELGDVLARFDLGYRGVRVAVEYDGRQHADSAKQHERDIDRREDIDSWQWRIVVITAKGIYQEPQRTLTRVAAVLRERGLPGVPSRLDDRWRPHFPGPATSRRDR